MVQIVGRTSPVVLELEGQISEQGNPRRAATLCDWELWGLHEKTAKE